MPSFYPLYLVSSVVLHLLCVRLMNAYEME